MFTSSIEKTPLDSPRWEASHTEERINAHLGHSNDPPCCECELYCILWHLSHSIAPGPCDCFLSDANLTTLAVTLSLTSVALQTKTARAVTACELVRDSSMNADDHRSR